MHESCGVREVDFRSFWQVTTKRKEDPVTVASRPTLLFRTSTRCSTGGCVEVAPLPDGGAVVRDTKDRVREPLVFDRQEWADFVWGVKHGEFDL